MMRKGAPPFSWTRPRRTPSRCPGWIISAALTFGKPTRRRPTMRERRTPVMVRLRWRRRREAAFPRRRVSARQRVYWQMEAGGSIRRHRRVRSGGRDRVGGASRGHAPDALDRLRNCSLGRDLGSARYRGDLDAGGRCSCAAWDQSRLERWRSEKPCLVAFVLIDALPAVAA